MTSEIWLTYLPERVLDLDAAGKCVGRGRYSLLSQGGSRPPKDLLLELLRPLEPTSSSTAEGELRMNGENGGRRGGQHDDDGDGGDDDDLMSVAALSKALTPLIREDVIVR